MILLVDFTTIVEVQVRPVTSSGSYLSVAPGAGVNYRLSRRFMVRGEYEYQFWLNSPNFANEPARQLKPSGFHLGVSFRVFR